jgi:hypothetical protein
MDVGGPATVNKLLTLQIREYIELLDAINY